MPHATRPPPAKAVAAGSLPARTSIGDAPIAVRDASGEGRPQTHEPSPGMATPSAADLAAVIAALYDAALDPSRWSGTLRMAAEFTGGQAAMIFSKDTASRSGTCFVDDGRLDREYLSRYFDTYARIDPGLVHHCRGEIGRPVCQADVYDHDEFVGSRFYQEWSRPQGIADAMITPLERSASSTAMAGFFRKDGDGPCDERMRERAALIAPHLRRTLLVSQAIEQRRVEAAGLADTLDGLGAGVFLVDDEGRLAHANASGRTMLAERSVLALRDGRLAPREDRHRHAFRGIAAAAADGDAEAGALGIDLPLEARDGEAHVAHVLPLAGGDRRQAGAKHAAAAAVFVRRARIEAPSSHGALARRFDLTPTEMRVLVALAEVGGVPEVAEALGVAVSTAKTHVHRLLGKTGAARQAELVKLLAGYSLRLLR